MATRKNPLSVIFPFENGSFPARLDRTHSHVAGSLTAPFCFVDEASQLTEPAILHAFRKAAVEAGNASG